MSAPCIPKWPCCPPAIAPSCTALQAAGAWSHFAAISRGMAVGHRGVSADELMRHTYVLEGGCRRHAFRVASGLDSMVLGEPQILGQMKQAVREADTAGTLGTTAPVVSALVCGGQGGAYFHRNRALHQHGGCCGSAGWPVVRRPIQNQGAVRRRGRDDRTHRPHFAARSPRTMAVANRTLARGENWPTTWVPKPYDWRTCPSACTNSTSWCRVPPAPLPSLGWARWSVPSRHANVPMFMVDLAVPATSAEIGSLDDVYLYTVDDLSALVQNRRRKTPGRCGPGRGHHRNRRAGFVHWLDQRTTVPLIQTLHSQADAWRTVELTRARKMLAKGDDLEAVLEALSRGLTQKCCTAPWPNCTAPMPINDPRWQRRWLASSLRGDLTALNAAPSHRTRRRQSSQGTPREPRPGPS